MIQPAGEGLPCAYLHATHGSAGRVGPVGGDGDEADIPVALVFGRKVGHDCPQPRVLALQTSNNLDLYIRKESTH